MSVPVEWYFWFQRVPERPRFVRHLHVVAELVDQSEPGVDVSNILWGWEFADCIKVSAAWFDLVRRYLKPCELHCVFTEAELFGVEGDAILST